jgi:hypothetical protein
MTFEAVSAQPFRLSPRRCRLSATTHCVRNVGPKACHWSQTAAIARLWTMVTRSLPTLQPDQHTGFAVMVTRGSHGSNSSAPRPS